jgi:UDP-N-acetylglucosamine transferase subunit ALG13
MILVSVGTPTQPFDRLLKMVDAALTEEEAGQTVWQTGVSSFEPKAGRVVGVLAPQEFQQLLIQAEVFIGHAGAGSIMETLQMGKLPIVCARQRRYGEHVNDHQQEIAEEMAKRELILSVDSVEEVRAAINAVLAGKKPNASGWDIPRIQPVLAELLQAVEGQVNPRKGRP